MITRVKNIVSKSIQIMLKKINLQHDKNHVLQDIKIKKIKTNQNKIPSYALRKTEKLAQIF